MFGGGSGGGLLDWLTGSGGGPGGGTPMSPMPPSLMGLMDPMGNPTGQMEPAPTPAPAPTGPMPPPMPPGMDAASLVPPPAGPVPISRPDAPPMDPMTEGGLPGVQGAGPAPAPPLPMPRPDAANGPLPPGTPPPPVSLSPTDASAAMRSYTAAGGGRDVSGTLAPESGGPQAQGMIARALGLSPEVENRAKRGLAAGLKAAGNSSGKSPFQALTSGAGAAMEGENTSDDNEYNKKLKYLTAAVADKAAGNKEGYNNNYLKYLNAKLKSDQDKASGGSGKSGAWNKPDSQKFLDAQRAVSQDPDIKASQKVLESVLKTGSQADVAKAQADHAKLVADKQGQYVTAVGLDPAKIAFNQKTPPGTPPTKGPDGKTIGGNPHIVTSKADFDTYVKPGQAYINPKDNKVYIRKGGDNKSGADSPAAAPATPATPPLPPGLPPMMPGQSLPTSSDDDE